MSTQREADRAWVDVDLANLLANARTMQQRARGARLLPMVKADGYGLGASRVVATLEQLDPWGYGVATVDEGIELRRAGIGRPVLVFTPATLDQRSRYQHHGLWAVLDDVETIRAWRGPYHLEIDTGMGRAGLRWSDARSLSAVAVNPPDGALTHFHSADVSLADMEQQWARFETALSYLPERPSLVHAANSAAVWRIAEMLDLVRPGIFLYGGRAGPDLPAPRPVATVRARVVSVRRLAAGDTVSYGAEWSAPAPTVVATLGIGYADGVPRAVQNRAAVLIGGRRYPVIGRITMDMSMVAVSAAAGVAVGDVATVVGRDGDGEITLDEFADWAGTISYEILVGWGSRLPRIYRGT